MPSEMEMLLSASPPLFGFSALRDFHYSTFPNNQNGYRLLKSSHLDRVNNYNNSLRSSTTPRSCLSVKTDLVTVAETNDPNSPTSPTREKKKVWFADDKGLSLVQVHVMAEPSDCPPGWTEDFLSHVTRGVKPQVVSDNKWEPNFAQPASDYVVFRNRLARNCISLENVITREDEDTLTGTIKVKNLAFHKNVFVRATFDRWLTNVDVPANYINNGSENSVTYAFDTFSFTMAIPPSALKYGVVEFCVCFQCEGKEYWDNNGGINYRLIKVPVQKRKFNFIKPRFSDAVTADFNEWTQFASWDNLITEGPYW